VVTEFLDYSRPLKSSLAPGDAGEILQRTFRLLAPQVPEGIEIQLDPSPELPPVSCDPEQLKQVFLNLALNAFQAMPRGGRLRVTASLSRDELARWREPRFRDDRLEVRFRDTGPGIPAEARENIFVPFYTTKEKGTGLGLAISQRIIKSHGGSISVVSPPEGGAEFVVSLPCLQQEAPAGASEPGISMPKGERDARRRRRRGRRS
jgi:two-component system sensor histidine kinase HydH